MQSFVRRFCIALVLLPCLALAEPTLNEVYAAAQAGQLDQAQVMVQQVLVNHPRSAKAYFVQSELYARQGDLERARSSLATAEKLAPGLPFAQPQAVQKLRQHLSARPGVSGHPSSSSPALWFAVLALVGGVMVLGYFVFRPKRPDFYPQRTDYVAQPSWGGTPYAGGQPFPQSGGLGDRIMGGVATGLAVGAGMMAAEAIGRSLMGGDHPQRLAPDPSNGLPPADLPSSDLGGTNFGIDDAGSWDGGGAADGGWDN